MNDLVLCDSAQDGDTISYASQQEESNTQSSHTSKEMWNRTPGFRTVQEGNGEGQAEDGKVDTPKSKKGFPLLKFSTQEVEFDEDEDDVAIYQPTLWWFTSTAFPLFAGTFGPIANLFSVCALMETWKIRISDGSRIRDPTWLIAMNACSLLSALSANLILLFNFARRIRYSLAQPLTISLWYLSSTLLIIPIGLTHNPKLYADTEPDTTYSQSYYYALISSILYAVISTFLLWNVLGAYVFRAYPPSFNILTVPQRTLMLQTMSYSLYLALGAGVFSAIEGWGFVNALYWADYTLLTVGLGTDFPLTKTSARAILIPYTAFGVTLLGLVVSSVRALVLERAKEKVARRHLGQERDRWTKNIKRRRKHLDRQSTIDSGREQVMEQPSPLLFWFQKRKEKKAMYLPKALASHEPAALSPGDAVGPWPRTEFELMRHIEDKALHAQKYAALTSSFVVILIVWMGGSLIFWSCERKSQTMTYIDSFYFTYTTLLTIGYGDFYPISNAGKPFFVIWSLISVPAMTIFISNMGDTVVRWVEDATTWACSYTILPEKGLDKFRRAKHKMGRRRKKARKAEAAMKEKEKQEAVDMSGSTNDNDATSKQEPSSALHEKEDSNMGGLPEDVEKFGDAIQSAEENMGGGKRLSVRLAREISLLAKDVGKSPPRKYDWSDWSEWMQLLGANAEMMPSKSRESEPNSPNSPEDDLAHPSSPCPVTPTTLAIMNTGKTSAHADHQPGQDWNWTWLADKGPLLSQQTETEWILEKLCTRLEEVLECETQDAFDKTQ